MQRSSTRSVLGQQKVNPRRGMSPGAGICLRLYLYAVTAVGLCSYKRDTRILGRYILILQSMTEEPFSPRDWISRAVETYRAITTYFARPRDIGLLSSKPAFPRTSYAASTNNSWPSALGWTASTKSRAAFSSSLPG